jgi:hypothetical protein
MTPLDKAMATIRRALEVYAATLEHGSLSGGRGPFSRVRSRGATPADYTAAGMQMACIACPRRAPVDPVAPGRACRLSADGRRRASEDLVFANRRQ